MDQQTVSLVKAGIVTTLNACVAVLAAANSLFKRYNCQKSLSENANLPNLLLSRLDLMFLILEVADTGLDKAVASHVTFVHQNKGSDGDMDLDKKHFKDGERGGVVNDPTPGVLREYITRAWRHQSVVPKEMVPCIVDAYVSLRLQGIPVGGH